MLNAWTSSSAVPVAANESATSYSIRCPDGTLTSVEDIQQHEVLTCCDGAPVQVIRAVRHEREEHQEAMVVAQGHGAHCISLAMVGTRCLAGESGVSKGGAEKVSRRQCDARASNPK